MKNRYRRKDGRIYDTKQCATVTSATSRLNVLSERVDLLTKNLVEILEETNKVLHAKCQKEWVGNTDGSLGACLDYHGFYKNSAAIKELREWQDKVENKIEQRTETV